MADISTPSDAQRLAALEAQLAEFQAAQQAKQATEKAQRLAREKTLAPPEPKVVPNRWAERVQARQDARAAAGRQATAELDRLIEEKLAANRDQRLALQEKIRDINGRMAAEQARCDKALAKLGGELRTLRAKLSDLEAPPPSPAITPEYAADDKQFFATYGQPYRA